MTWLLDQSHTGRHIWENTTYSPFGAYSRTLPQGVEMFLSNKQSPNEFSPQEHLGCCWVTIW